MAFFKLEKPKQFTFIPRFYDERKEELDDRIESIKREIDPQSDAEYRPSIRGQMRRRHDALYGKVEQPKKRTLGRWMMVVIYIGLVLVIVYMVIQILSYLY